MPDPVLRTTLVETHPRLAFYLHKCHEYFSAKEAVVIKTSAGNYWKGLFQGWGVDRGKRMEDLIGIGGLVGGVVGYTLWNRLRQ